MGLLSGLFSKDVQLQDIRPTELQQLGKSYVGSLQKGIQDFVPGQKYGSMTVPLTDIEKQSLDLTGQYLNQDILQNQPYSAGRANILSSLAGGYDPYTSPEYQAYRTGTQREQEQAISEARRGQTLRGAFRGTGGLRQESDILTDVANKRQTLLADLANRERERQTAAATTALGLGQYEFGLPATKAATAQQLGSLERLNNIANLEREYQQYLNQRQEQVTALGYAGQASNYGQPMYGQTSYKSPTFLGSLVSSVAPMVGYGLASGLGGGGGGLSTGGSSGGGMSILGSGGLSSILSGKGMSTGF